MHFKDTIILIRVDITCGVVIYAMSGNSVLLDASAILKKADFVQVRV